MPTLSARASSAVIDSTGTSSHRSPRGSCQSSSAAAAPISVLLLGALGIVEEATDIWLAFGVGFVALAAQGARYARVERLGAAGMAAVIALNLALGGVVVALKVLVSH